MLVGMRITCRCLVKQLPFLYALPQCSQSSSLLAAVSSFVRPVLSLALRVAALGMEDKDGPFARALWWLPDRLGTEARCVGTLMGIAGCESSSSELMAAFDSESGQLMATDPSSTPFSTAASIAAALPGANDELFLRLMRPLTKAPGCMKCVRLYDWQVGRLFAVELTDRRDCLVCRDMSCMRLRLEMQEQWKTRPSFRAETERRTLCALMAII